MTDTAEKPSRGRKRTAHIGDRLTRAQIALRCGHDREIVTKYLAMEGAPKPDEKMRFSYKEALAWIQAQSPRLGANAVEIQKMREAKMRLELESLEHDMRVKRGQYIDKSRIAAVFTVVNQSLTAKMRDVFEKEIPPRLEGRTQTERTTILAEGIDRVLKSLKADMERYGSAA
jgi:hypothetical protein